MYTKRNLCVCAGKIELLIAAKLYCMFITGMYKAGGAFFSVLLLDIADGYCMAICP